MQQGPRGRRPAPAQMRPDQGGALIPPCVSVSDVSIITTDSFQQAVTVH